MGEESTGSFLGMGRNALVLSITGSVGAAWPSYFSALASVLAAAIVFAFLRKPEKKET